MMILQAELDGKEEITWEDVSDEANRLYFDNEDRMIQPARPGDDLVPLESGAVGGGLRQRAVVDGNRPVVGVEVQRCGVGLNFAAPL